jgi:hypothetical protein
MSSNDNIFKQTSEEQLQQEDKRTIDELDINLFQKLQNDEFFIYPENPNLEFNIKSKDIINTIKVKEGDSVIGYKAQVSDISFYDNDIKGHITIHKYKEVDYVEKHINWKKITELTVENKTAKDSIWKISSDGYNSKKLYFIKNGELQKDLNSHENYMSYMHDICLTCEHGLTTIMLENLLKPINKKLVEIYIEAKSLEFEQQRDLKKYSICPAKELKKPKSVQTDLRTYEVKQCQ